MVNEFKAEMVNGELVVHPIIIKEKGDVRVIVPSFKLIKELKDKFNK
jgi:hypothetical protein